VGSRYDAASHPTVPTVREMFEVTRESVTTEPVYRVVCQGRGLGIAEEPKPTPVCGDDRIWGRPSPMRGRTGSAGRAGWDLRQPGSAGPGAGQAGLRLRGSRRAERQEHYAAVRVYALRPEGAAGVRTPSVSSTVSGSPPVAAPRLSIVVLPFTNLSDDREQQYFSATRADFWFANGQANTQGSPTGSTRTSTRV
jgi:hypothetical protein